MALLCASACGGAAENATDDPLSLLRVGVDLTDEGARMRNTLVSTGYAMVAAQSTPRFVALNARASNGHTALRVATSRGPALAEDAGDMLDASSSVSLLVPEHHADDASELLVRRVARETEQSCIDIYAVSADGFITRIDVDIAATNAPRCIAVVADADDDGVLEAYVEKSFPELAIRGVIPKIRIPLMAASGKLTAEASPHRHSLLALEIGGIRDDLQMARSATDVARAHSLAVALAEISLIENATSADAQRTYDDAMSGLVLTESEAAMVNQTREALGHQGGPDLHDAD